MRVLGVDPGHKDCALVVRDGDTLVAMRSLTRSGQDRAAWATWCAAHTLEVVGERQVEAVGVENIAAPNPHVGKRDGPRFIDVAPLLDTAAVVGAVASAVLTAGTAVAVVLVEPAGFGAPLPSRRHLLAAYPADLVGPRERTGAGKSRWQHLRSGWDVAGATPRLVHAQQTGHRQQRTLDA